MHESFLFLSSVCCAVSHASFVIAVKPTRHFSYSSGSRSSMYFLMLVLACCLRKYTSLLIIDKSTCSTFAISDWLSPLLSSSRTLVLRHSTCIFVLIYCISPCVLL